MPTDYTDPDPVRHAAHILSQHIEDTYSVCEPIEEEGGLNYIRRDAAPEIAEQVQECIAEVVADFLNAGSEREVVLEDEQLTVALRSVFADWGPEPTT